MKVTLLTRIRCKVRNKYLDFIVFKKDICDEKAAKLLTLQIFKFQELMFYYGIYDCTAVKNCLYIIYVDSEETLLELSSAFF